MIAKGNRKKQNDFRRLSDQICNLNSNLENEIDFVKIKTWNNFVEGKIILNYEQQWLRFAELGGHSRAVDFRHRGTVQKRFFFKIQL